MSSGLYARVLRPALFRTGGGDPEVAHERTVRAVAKLAQVPGARAAVRALHVAPQRPREIAGVPFPGPVGLAAGLDKFGIGVRSWSALGFSHVELGTVTARPQPGNPTPRLFRLPQSGAIINRMGFNNPGADALAARLQAAGIRRGTQAAGIPVGISLGKSKLTPVADAVGDYLYSLDRLAPFADYVAINVSSPNTPGLRSLQDRGALEELLTALVARARELSEVPVPIFVKLAPDLDRAGIDTVLTVAHDRGAAAIIATNTTIGRDHLAATETRIGAETGGLSGAPLTQRAREVVAHCAAASELPVIGVGGIMAADDARALLDRGAAMVQIYTGYIYAGPTLVNDINRSIHD